MDGTRAQAAWLDRCAEQLADTARQLARLTGPDRRPGPDPSGRLGLLTDALHRQWQQALVDRAAEADAAGQRLTELATGLRAAADGYRDTDTAVGQQDGVGQQEIAHRQEVAGQDYPDGA
ncbi:type VII secretion target [Solwaraspora sp. WMMB335]|uniref:type VII secretion target n=1 Tax=Solwaraspora sp. WMMB335 TaxID=3404118 RepID=UPI003B94A2AF